MTKVATRIKLSIQFGSFKELIFVLTCLHKPPLLWYKLRLHAYDRMKSVRGFKLGLKLGGNEVVDAHIVSTGGSDSCTWADRAIGIEDYGLRAGQE